MPCSLERRRRGRKDFDAVGKPRYRRTIMSDFVTRFAPSPTGELHLGSAFSALVAYDAARDAGGRFLLRIEDVDHTRCRDAYVDMILDALDWLGIAWEAPLRVQSEHIKDYRAALAELEARGLVYRCFKSRADIAAEFAATGEAAAGPDGDLVYKGPKQPLSRQDEDVKLAQGAPFAWRLSLAAAEAALGDAYRELSYCEQGADGRRAQKAPADPSITGDAVLWRKDGAPSYHIAVVHDDALQGVTHVIRGDDLRSSTPVHVLLQKLLGLPTPVYRHHRLLVDADGRRYSKRDRSLSIRALRDDGVRPDDIRARIGLSL